MSSLDPPTGSSLPRSSISGILYSAAFRSIAYQVAMAIFVLLAGYYLYSNVTENLRAQNIATGFRFLSEVSQFEIGEALIDYSSRDTYFRALLVGLFNTLAVSAVGIVVATVIGFSVGIARTSDNWLLSKLARFYVEIVRNIPVILQVIFWSVVIRNLPAPRGAFELWGAGFLSNRGLTIAMPLGHPSHFWMLIGLVAGVVLSIGAARLVRRWNEQTGKHVDSLWVSLALILGLPLLIWLASGAPLDMSVPARTGFSFSGGSTLSPEFVALLMGISIYASGFIAEIVRSGIQATPRGQIEAAKTIGLKPWFITRYIVMPQALRVIVPPLTSQYVSLSKNSSIAVVVGYPDLVNIGNTVMNQTGQAVEAVAIMMIVYLTISVCTSLLMNFYNRLVAIKER
ncbi:ABC transporter permease subunit [Rhizobium sp. AG855]|uniref:amino acid ABC transporter permease n=1 Tax=Rhizobium sp. AG855 TaxID=2183898 RepID=UPI000FF4C06C|nr:ABC transporter permease subunit [Rhizobium sp. AG855]RKE78180.1 amino acid ABC transporter membrane protein 1 (PAAT family) [Rhizobium sp. AG855]